MTELVRINLIEGSRKPRRRSASGRANLQVALREPPPTVAQTFASSCAAILGLKKDEHFCVHIHSVHLHGHVHSHEDVHLHVQLCMRCLT